MTTVEEINELIKTVDSNQVSDGYHTFGELYEHRIALWILLLRCIAGSNGAFSDVWRSKAHSDGSVWDGWFILGFEKMKGQQMTYHLPMSKWDECSFAETLLQAPKWDGHTSDDVLKRIESLSRDLGKLF
ncbi:hypothetical protein GCM10028807_57980 [Spirosoma daeguense]